MTLRSIRAPGEFLKHEMKPLVYQGCPNHMAFMRVINTFMNMA